MPSDGSGDINVAIEKLGELISAIEGHVLWTPPEPNKTLFFMWDFIQRSHHMLKEVPNTLRQSGRAAAAEAVSDVAGRSQFALILMNDTTGKFSMMVGQDPNNPVDFGDTVKDKAQAAIDACPMTLDQDTSGIAAVQSQREGSVRLV